MPLEIVQNVRSQACEIAQTGSEDGASTFVSPHAARIHCRQAGRSEGSISALLSPWSGKSNRSLDEVESSSSQSREGGH